MKWFGNYLQIASQEIQKGDKGKSERSMKKLLKDIPNCKKVPRCKLKNIQMGKNKVINMLRSVGIDDEEMALGSAIEDGMCFAKAASIAHVRPTT